MIANLEAKALPLIRYATDFEAFCKEVLGYHDLIAPHTELCNFLHLPNEVKLILMPRYSFKSSICTVGYALWRLVREDSLRILIYSDSVTTAEGFLNEIKNHLLGQKEHSHFRDIYGPWEVDPKRGVWNQSAIVIRPRSTAHAEPSIDTAGLESSKVGRHYDLIIFDDLVTKENVTTKDLMDKVAQCYQAARSLLKPGGEMLLVGTRWHFGDLYGRLLIAPSGPLAFVKDAEQDGDVKYPFAKIGLTKERLATLKAEQGTRLYSALYRNAPQSSEEAVFKPEDFRFYDPTPSRSFQEWVATLYITAVLDAIPPPTSDHGDDAALTIVGTDHEGTLFLLDAVSERMTPDAQLDELFSLYWKWKFKKFGLETNAFQRMMKTEFERRYAEERKRPGFVPFSVVEFSGTSQGNKEQRIQGLQPWHERGALRFPGERLDTLTGVWSKLAYQMIEFPFSAHDDLLDSLAYHLQLKQLGSLRPILPDLPYTSAAWFEREQQKEDLRVMARRPRWQRSPVPSLSFS